MFGKSKNKNLIKVMHYEGLMDFAQDYPCTIEMKDDVFEIKKIKPDATVILPKNQIISFGYNYSLILFYHKILQLVLTLNQIFLQLHF